MKDNTETVNVKIEDLLSAKLQENDESLKATLPGTEEHERLARERDMLMKIWLDLIKQQTDTPSLGRRIVDGVKVGVDILAKAASVAIPTFIIVGTMRLGNRAGYLSADDVNSLTRAERMLVK